MLAEPALKLTDPVPGLGAPVAAIVAVMVTVGVVGYGVVGPPLSDVNVGAVTSKELLVAPVKVPSLAVML